MISTETMARQDGVLKLRIFSQCRNMQHAIGIKQHGYEQYILLYIDSKTFSGCVI